MNERTVKDSIVETRHIVRPADMNGAKRLYGGILMLWIDEVAAMVAKRHSMMSVTTLSVDKLLFIHGAHVDDMIVIVGKIVYVGNTSMVIQVETKVEHLNGDQCIINKAYLTFVGLDDQERPARVPRLILENDEEREAYEEALTHLTLRKSF